MRDYKDLLILSYFFQYKKDYVLSRLQQILGLTLIQLEYKISTFIDDELLAYEDNLLLITSKGIQLVVSNNIEDFPFELNSENKMPNLESVTEILNINDIYIPKKFMDKICK